MIEIKIRILKLKNNYPKVSGCTFNIEKSSAYLITNIEQVEREMDTIYISTPKM